MNRGLLRSGEPLNQTDSVDPDLWVAIRTRRLALESLKFQLCKTLSLKGLGDR